MGGGGQAARREGGGRLLTDCIVYKCESVCPTYGVAVVSGTLGQRLVVLGRLLQELGLVLIAAKHSQQKKNVILS